jgi:16S rRNA (uracil1498-N3)-methyltransferase
VRLTRLHVDAALAEGAVLELPAAAASHVARVLRGRSGDAIVLFNGDGREFAAVIETVRGARVTVAIGAGRPVDRESPAALTLLQCVARGERMDWIVQKTTELGVARIVPLISERSVVRLSAAQADAKLGHWRAVAVSACEQSGRNRVPQVEAPVRLLDFLGASSAAGERLVLDPEAPAGAPGAARADALELAVGPEGGFAPDESEALRIAGFRGMRLGPRILRTETAAIAAVAWLQARFGDLDGPAAGVARP